MDVSLINLISMFVALVLLASYGGFLFFLAYQEKTKEHIDWNRRLAEILKPPVTKAIETSSLLKEGSSDPEIYLKSKLPKVEGITQWLQHSGFDINPTMFLGGSAFLGGIVFLILFFIFNMEILISLLLSLVSSFIVPWLVITYLANLQKTKFLEEFPIALDMIQRALRAGHSSERALEMVATRTTGPIATTFQQISEKINLGEPPEVVLADLSNRIGIDEFRMLSIVLILQRETGGSLAEAVENFSKIIRARQNLRKKVKALTGEVRATAMILSSIPFVISVLIYLTSPTYLDPLFYTPTGHTLLLIGGGMLALGITIIFRMAYKEIY